MTTESCHLKQDLKSMKLAQAVVDVIESNSIEAGIKIAKGNIERWKLNNSNPCLLQWEDLLSLEWSEIKKQYLAPNQIGQELRQNSPFCGILKPQERWQLLKGL